MAIFPEDYLLSLPQLVRNYRILRVSAAAPALRRRIFKTCLFTLFPGLYGGRSKTTAAAGFRVKYCTVESFLYLFREIFLRQVYWFDAGNPAPVIVDCGANIGMASLYFKAVYPGAEILAFEPDPDAFACLRENLRLNGISGVEAREEAVMNAAGTVPLYSSLSGPGALGISVLRGRADGPPRAVRAVRLSDRIIRRIDLLKLDIEGAETGVLAELKASGKLPMINRIWMEYHHHIDGSLDSFSGALEMLESAGFGYQLSASPGLPFQPGSFQDIMVYAYNKTALTGRGARG
ncbi:MAG: hypothetical protein COT18_00435 [Elusimicrobia bacterium CG08_land_8_20_14_0_20_59_10]|nr:MAG: hypothetical protein COT18_00435 [Elusimicrobia bacterium CG08_land_8_20_14_0_20_59_10]